MAFVENGDLTVSIFRHGDTGIAHGIARARSLDLVDDLVVLKGEVLGEGAGFLPGQDAVEVVGGRQGTVGIMWATRGNSEAGVEVLHELRKIGVASRHVGDVSQAHLLDEAILQGLDGALNAAFGLWGVGADNLDVQCLHRAPKLGQTGSRDRIKVIDAENAVFIAVEGDGLAMLGEVSAHHFTIGEHGLAQHKRHGHQPPGSIVDEYQQRAGSPTTFKPIMR